MTIEDIKKILAVGENTEIEFKQSQTKLARSVYESICAFLNRRGGHVVLGADNTGKMLGVNDDSLQEQLDTLVKDMNNPQLFKPTYYLDFEVLKIDGLNLIHCYVPESTQAHMYKGEFYDRNRDGDFVLRSTEQIANLFIRKSKLRTEDRVYPVFGIGDLDSDAFDFMRKLVKADDPDHEWLKMDNEALLRSGQMIKVDPETGKEGITLAAILLFGKRNTIASVLPKYAIDLLCRVQDTELYDDRVQVKENLMVAYGKMMNFVEKHLPEKPYIEGMQRFSLRDKIMREVCLNMLIHREYSSAYPASLTIWNDRIETENWNVPYVYGRIDLNTLKPHRKNPVIANVFSQMGIVEELGSGTKKIFKYTPLFSDGKEPEIEEQDVYRITIPFSGIVNREHELELSPALSPALSRALSQALSWDMVEPMFRKLQQPCLAKELRSIYDLSDASKFKKRYLDPFIKEGIIAMTKPDKPTSSNQRYFLTEEGLEIWNVMKK